MSLPNNTCRGHCGAPSAHVPVATRCVTTSDNNTRPKQFYTVGTEIASFSEPLDWFECNGRSGNKKVCAVTSQHPARLLTETLVASFLFFFSEDEKIMATTLPKWVVPIGAHRGHCSPSLLMCLSALQWRENDHYSQTMAVSWPAACVHRARHS